MTTYFARHAKGLDVDDETRKMLWNSRRIAVHFPYDKRGKLLEDSKSADPTDYDESAARVALTALNALASEGGYVCAQHLGYEEVQLGFVPPGSRIELVNGKWGTLLGLKGRTAILKSLPLERVRVIKPSDYAINWEGRPRQRTLTKWPSAGQLIENIVERSSEQPD
jgi:hypothetical protein